MALGRPRNFDKDQALERALEVFWRKGYEGASICDLTAAMGINPPSLYAAFGNKEGLFCKALDRYVEAHAGFVREALAQPKARDGIAALLRATADSLTDKSNPAGCLLVQGIAGAGEHAQCIRDELSARRAAGEKTIRERLKRARAEGELPDAADPAALARYVATVMQGMAVQATGGATRAELRRVADTAMAAWPE
ncbi:MAG: TetR/AcrR family transcriptional regulator [Methyloceanibacter sp.]